MGTRHRSAYRLCARFPDAIAIVISQDGGVRFVAWHEGAVTYWDHTSLGSEEA
jgi:DNA integrity scanning protein DisA with diadenylate cyclase activity